METIIKITSYIISAGAVIALATKFVLWLYKKGRNTEKADNKVEALEHEIEGMKNLLNKVVDTTSDHSYRIKQCENSIEANHSSVMIELEKLSKEVQEFRSDNTKIMTKLIDTINNVTINT